MTKTYDVSIRVPASKLATIIETLDGEGELLGVTATAAEPRKVRATRQRSANGVRGADIVLEVAKGGAEVTAMQFAQAFQAKGFALNSASPAVSNAIKRGELVQVRKSVYRIAPRKGAAT